MTTSSSKKESAMKKPSKKLDLHHQTRPLGRLELARAVGGAMMAYAVDNPLVTHTPQPGDTPQKFGPWI
jgi:hypothetical protein